MQIYFIRHGENEINHANSYQGWTDTPLTHKGEKQADALKNYFFEEKMKKFDNIFASRSDRAKKTADFLKSCTEKKEIILLDGFKSINVALFTLPL